MRNCNDNMKLKIIEREEKVGLSGLTANHQSNHR